MLFKAGKLDGRVEDEGCHPLVRLTFTTVHTDVFCGNGILTETVLHSRYNRVATGIVIML